MSTLHRPAKKRVVYFAESDSEMDSEDSDEVVAAPKRKKAASNCKGSGKTDKGDRGEKKRVSIDSDSDDFELGPDADDKDESIAADSESDFESEEEVPKKTKGRVKNATSASRKPASKKGANKKEEEGQNKAFVGHGEVPRASFMNDTAIDLPDNDEQGNNTNADNVVR